MSALLQLALIAYVPGALIYRLPIADRDRRARLAIEERAFWAVMISVVISSAIVLALASVEVYAFRALVAIDALIAIAVLLGGHTRLLYRGTAARPTLTVLIPIAIVLAGLWLYFPPAEYIMGGKDPGVYMNEGIQIAQRGSLVVHDDAVSSVPAPFRDLFFPSYNQPYYYSSRFMGFFLLDPDAGTVLGQFPHLLPAWIAVGYGLDGLTGTREVTGAWAILGLLAIYIAGARTFGRFAAAAGAALVAINVIQVWFGRYPNAEIVMQALLFGALAAWSRADVDEDGFFAPVSASLLGLLLFLRFDAVLALAGFRRPRVSFLVTLAVWLLFAGWYLFGLMQPYMAYPIGYIHNLAWWQTAALIVVALALIALAGIGLAWSRRAASAHANGAGSNVTRTTREEISAKTADPTQEALSANIAGTAEEGLSANVAGTAREGLSANTSFEATASGAEHSMLARLIDRWLPPVITIVILLLAAYAYFLRDEGGRTAIHDAMALRSFAWYVTPIGLALAAAGYAIAMQTTFRRDPVLLATVTIFGLFFFYKIRIVPEHYWMARRFLPVILPGAMLLVGYAAFSGLRLRPRFVAMRGAAAAAGAAAIGIVVVSLVGWQFWRASQPLLSHVEYAGLIPKLEKLSTTFGDRDLVVVESRAAGSELHVLALPLAYVYARNVLVLNTPRPDPIVFREFLSWARSKYEQVYFLGGGGTDLLSRTVGIVPVTSDRFWVPEWESTPNALPHGPRRKAFDLSVYRFTDASAAAAAAATQAGGRGNGSGSGASGANGANAENGAGGGAPGAGVALDVGAQDDVNVVRFHLKEVDGRGVTYRWTQDASYISLVGLRADSRSLVLVMNDGHRPAKLPPARVEVSLDDQVLGYVDVGRDFHTYTVPIPPAVAAAAAARDTPARLKLATTVWKPRDVLGTPDDRLLGVMVDRVEVR